MEMYLMETKIHTTTIHYLIFCPGPAVQTAAVHKLSIVSDIQPGRPLMWVTDRPTAREYIKMKLVSRLPTETKLFCSQNVNEPVYDMYVNHDQNSDPKRLAFSLKTGKSLNQSKLSNSHQIKHMQPSTTEVFLHRSDLFTILLSSL